MPDSPRPPPGAHAAPLRRFDLVIWLFAGVVACLLAAAIGPEAAAALFLPSILLGLLCGLVFVVFLRVAGPSINEIFQQLQQTAP